VPDVPEDPSVPDVPEDPSEPEVPDVPDVLVTPLLIKVFNVDSDRLNVVAPSS